MSELTRDWRALARTTLFGQQSLPARIVLTPFASLLDRQSGVETEDGWWRVRRTRDVALVKVPQGSAAADAVLALEPGHEVTFIGLAGTLRGDDIPPGSLVEPGVAVAFDGTTGNRTWSRATTLPEVRIATVRSLADSTLQHAALARDFHCVDMEAAWVLSAAARAGCLARALIAVSDANSEGAVFRTGFARVQALLDEALDRALSTWTLALNISDPPPLTGS